MYHIVFHWELYWVSYLRSNIIGRTNICTLLSLILSQRHPNNYILHISVYRVFNPRSRESQISILRCNNKKNCSYSFLKFIYCYFLKIISLSLSLSLSFGQFHFLVLGKQGLASRLQNDYDLLCVNISKTLLF